MWDYCIKIFRKYIVRAEHLKYFCPYYLLTFVSTKNIDPRPIANVKNIKIKPIKSPENQACCEAKGATSLLENVSIEKLGKSKIPQSAKEKLKSLSLSIYHCSKNFYLKLQKFLLYLGMISMQNNSNFNIKHFFFNS